MKTAMSIASVAVLAFCAGTVVSFFTLPIWIIPLVEAAREGSRSDWLGFAGALISGALTSVVAAAAIYFGTRGIRQQVAVNLYSREEDRIEAELPGLRQAQNVMVKYLQDFRNFDERLAKGEARTFPLDIPTVRDMPNAPLKTREDVALTVSFLLGTAHEMVTAFDAFTAAMNHAALARANMLRTEAIQTYDNTRNDRELEFAERVRGFRQFYETAERQMLGYNRRMVDLEGRLMTYRREIERLLPK